MEISIQHITIGWVHIKQRGRERDSERWCPQQKRINWVSMAEERAKLRERERERERGREGERYIGVLYVSDE